MSDYLLNIVPTIIWYHNFVALSVILEDFENIYIPIYKQTKIYMVDFLEDAMQYLPLKI